MAEQRHEIGQVVRGDTLFVQCQDEAVAGGFDQVIAVLDPFRDALGGHEFADIEFGEEGRKRFSGYLRVDSHSNPRSPKPFVLSRD